MPCIVSTTPKVLSPTVRSLNLPYIVSTTPSLSLLQKLNLPHIVSTTPSLSLIQKLNLPHIVSTTPKVHSPTAKRLKLPPVVSTNKEATDLLLLMLLLFSFQQLIHGLMSETMLVPMHKRCETSVNQNIGTPRAFLQSCL